MVKKLWTYEQLASLFDKLAVANRGGFPLLSTTIVETYGRDPFLLLVACLLSLRARDQQTWLVCKALFARIRTPQELRDIPQAELEQLIKPIGMYRNKARTLQAVAAALLERHGGKVPATEAELLALPGVGRKTANFVLSIAFGIPAICVDVHVHRIANLLGIVDTKTPEETERELMRLLPPSDWTRVNELFVMWGQRHRPKIRSIGCVAGCACKQRSAGTFARR